MSSNLNVFDTNYLGETDSNGKVIVYYNKDAISNALKLWLTTFPNEILNDPSKAGALYYYLAQPMTDETKEDIRDSIASGIENEFTPYLKVEGVSVTADNVRNKWIIKLKCYSIDFDESFIVDLDINSLA